jgi:hypothetical protein
MLNKDPELTQGRIGSFLLIAQLWSRALFALTGLLGWDAAIPAVPLRPVFTGAAPLAFRKHQCENTL